MSARWRPNRTCGVQYAHDLVIRPSTPSRAEQPSKKPHTRPSRHTAEQPSVHRTCGPVALRPRPCQAAPGTLWFYRPTQAAYRLYWIVGVMKYMQVRLAYGVARVANRSESVDGNLPRPTPKTAYRNLHPHTEISSQLA